MYFYYASLKMVPVRAQDLGEFFAPNPWTGNPREKWSINVYTLTSETYATNARWNFINKEKKNPTDLATRRQKVQSRKLGMSSAIGIESPDGRVHMLPRVLIELWQAREVQDETLPTLLRDFEPSLKRSDFKMKRLRMIFKVESYLFLAFSILALTGFLILHGLGSSPHAQIRPSQSAWLSEPMTEHSIWAQGQGVPAEHCFRLRTGLVHAPAGLNTYGDLNMLCSFKAQNESRLMLMEAYGGNTVPSSLILRGVVLPPAQFGLSPQLMGNLAQRVPGLNTNLILAYNVDWAGQNNMAEFGELATVLGWGAPICLVPFLIFLVVSSFWRKRDKQLKEQFRVALGRSYAGYPMQTPVQQL
jgi:hypothetical protein